jgi:hypothetical protein
MLAARIPSTPVVIVHSSAVKPTSRSHGESFRTQRPGRTSLPAEKLVGLVLALQSIPGLENPADYDQTDRKRAQSYRQA